MRLRGRSGRAAGGVLAAILVALTMIVPAALPFLVPNPSAKPDVPLQATPAGTERVTTPPAGLHFDYLAILVMENHGICDILTWCGGNATYMTGLASAFGLAKQYRDCNDPSLPNYLCLSGGTDFGCGGYDGLPHSNPCTRVAWNATNVVDRLEAKGLTWKAYMEAMPSNCYGGNSGNYYARHDPFVYYSDIVNNATRCNRVIPSGTNASALIADLNSTTNAPNYAWFTPDKCNDMHSCSVRVGDTYLSKIVPQVLATTIFKTKRAALLITFDEDGTTSKPYLYTVWAGPAAKLNYTSTAAYNHFSVLSTIESNWNLTPLTANDTNAPNMNEFFATPPPPPPPGKPVARFTYTPTWPKPNASVMFNASTSTNPNPNSTLQFRWDWTSDGTWDTAWNNSPIAKHAYIPTGSYPATLQVKTTNGTLDNVTHSIPVDGLPPVTTATLRGPNGANGWFTGIVNVTLAATDNVSGVATTSYRLDGGAAQTYPGPFNVIAEGLHTLVYHSTDNAGNIEANKTASFKKDATPPSTSATFAGRVNGTHFVTPILVNLTASDITSGVNVTKYRLDSGPWTTYTLGFLVNNTGSHTVGYNSTDNAGNREATNSFSAINGTIIGAAVLSSKAIFNGTLGSANWYKSAVKVTLVLVNGTSPPDVIRYSLDSGPWTLYSHPFNVTGDGLHTLRFNASDGGIRELMHNVTIKIDTTPPTSTATLSGTLGNQGWYTSNVTVTLNATDATSGVASITCRIDNGTWKKCSPNPFGLTEGRHLVKFTAFDNAGWEDIVHNVSIKIDTTPPAATANLSGTRGSNGWYLSNVTVTLNATDASSGVAGIQYRHDNGSWGAYTVPFVLSGGRHYLEYFATDVAGLVEPIDSAVIAIDKDSPVTVAAFSGTLGNNGWYVSNVSVTLSATDPSSGIASISYRIDNGSWVTYAVPFIVTEGRHALDYFATDRAGRIEAAHHVGLWIDTTRPEATATLTGTPGANGWYISNVNVSLNATDAGSGVATISVKVDNGSWGIYLGPFVLGGGRHVLQFYATDRAGLVESVQTVNVNIDTDTPVTVARFAGTLGNNSWYVSNVSVTLSATDPSSGIASIAYQVDGGPWTTYAGPFVLTEGRHVLHYRATDLAGNVEPAQTIGLLIDTTPPTTRVDLAGRLGQNGWYTSTVTVTLNATDALSGVDKVMCRVDGGPWGRCSAPFALADGRHRVEFYATDLAGLVEATRAMDIWVDTIPPATTATPSGTAGQNGWFVSNVNVALNASDAMSGVASIWYSVDSGPWTAYSGPFVLTEGRHTLRFNATDLAGIVEATRTLLVLIDTTPPTSTATISGTLGNLGWYISNVTVTLTATDATSGVYKVTCRVDGGPWQTYSSPFTLGDGRHLVECYATDLAGLVEAVHSTNVAIDTQPPDTRATLSGTLGQNGWYVSSVNVSLNATDAGSGVGSIWYQIDSGLWLTYTGAFTVGDGAHVVQFYASDLAGLVEPFDSANVLVDTTPPVTTASLLGTAGDNGWYTSAVTVTLSASDLSSGVAAIWYVVDNGTWLRYTGPFLLQEGSHVVQYYAVDVAGVREATHSLSILIDTTPPTAQAALSGVLGNNSWYVSDVTVTLSAADSSSGVAGISYRVDSGPWLTYAGTIRLSDGSHILQVYATDVAGLTGAVQTVNVNVDTQAPSVRIDTPRNNDDIANRTVQVNWTASDATSGLDHFEITVDGGPVTIRPASVGAFIVSGLPDGVHTVRLTAVDHAGHAQTASVVFAIDTTPSFIAISSPRAGDLIPVSSVTVTWTALDTGVGIDHFEVTLDGGTPQTFPAGVGTATFAGLTDGVHSVKVRAVDKAGNLSFDFRVFTVDATAPTATISSPTPDAIVASGSVQLVWSGSDATSGIDHYEVSADGGAPISLAATTYTFASLADGGHSFEVTAFDRAGHSTSLSVRVVVDTTPPTASISSPAASAILTSNTLTITWTATDATSGIDHFDLALDGGAALTLPGGTRAYALADVPDGPHLLRIRAVDAAGNAAAVTVAVMVDTTPPLVSITGPTGESVVTSTVATVTWTASDAASGIDRITISVDGGATSTLSATATSQILTDLANGAHTVTVTVFDRAGHSSASTVTFRVATTNVVSIGQLDVALVMTLILILLIAGVAAVLFIRRRRDAT